MRNTTEQNITTLATDRFSHCPDPRLREVVTSLVKHLHGFIRDVEPTEAEWMAGIQFLTSVGKMCDEKRQEFILMSDVLGVSILVDAINHRLPDRATPSTVVGPFHIHDSPDFQNGANMAVGAPGVPLVLTHGWPSTFIELLKVRQISFTASAPFPRASAGRSGYESVMRPSPTMSAQPWRTTYWATCGRYSCK